ncbi:hypothetical protein SAMN05444920_115225 [Nonomuraea solani]|uniref:Uncharacterized protein n=1 Tax=Nonomuraea solani TaxID=1144553 RepID=A0A1H6ETB7_9ACTN|nr:hypothetical protein [Nonomuraea solani]SEH00246.1 hypothetical protein SAMN05444920_115225 [Nonomuraea solani]
MPGTSAWRRRLLGALLLVLTLWSLTATEVGHGSTNLQQTDVTRVAEGCSEQLSHPGLLPDESPAWVAAGRWTGVPPGTLSARTVVTSEAVGPCAPPPFDDGAAGALAAGRSPSSLQVFRH